MQKLLISILFIGFVLIEPLISQENKLDNITIFKEKTSIENFNRKKIWSNKKYFNKNFYLKTGVPYGLGLGLKIIPESKNYLKSFYIDYSDLNLAGLNDIILNEISETDGSNLNLKQIEIGYNRFFHRSSKFYTSIGINYWIFQSRILNPKIVNFNGIIDLNFNSVHPIIKIGYKTGNKFFFKSELGFAYFFPKKIELKGNFTTSSALLSAKINVYPHNANIPIFYKRGFLIFNLICGFGFDKKLKK
tara:strand:- start:1186 stop:1926 length:741 start_codon:yes stop_codon:yes gene_type:complete